MAGQVLIGWGYHIKNSLESKGIFTDFLPKNYENLGTLNELLGLNGFCSNFLQQ